jgi:hypothetical protein
MMASQMGPEDDAPSKNINFDQLQELWQNNLRSKVREGRRKAAARD